MGVSWTTEQQQVIDLRNRNILVSAAAGSGKTAVLVERIVKIITDKNHPVDIDHLLIVTFTNAAAAEMRERIGNAIEKALDEQPGNEHLLRQLTLIHNAQITTIDSFCLYVVRNHFHEIDLEPNFRIGDEGELKLLREDVLGRVLEQNYEEPSEAFSDFVEGYASGRTDAALNEMILQLYEFSRSYPWPEKWLDSFVGIYRIENREELDRAEWLAPLTENICFVLKDCEQLLKQALAVTQQDDGPDMYEKAVRSDLEKYESLSKLTSFCELSVALSDIKYDRLASSRGFEGDPDKLELVKSLREQAKDVVKKLCKQYFFCSPEMMIEQLERTEPMLEEVVRLTKQFADEFAAAKRRKNLVDFHDVEHFALQILVDEETEKAKKTAEEFRNTFEEIMIDEYQDSNEVQETLLRSISREERGENNIFMVGDVKQSIYRFRLARPELFMKKYDSYSLEESTTQRIDLHKNFRSREEVLTCTNDIFYKIMARSLGNVEYDAEAALYPGASYPVSADFIPEILLADSNDELLEDTELTDKKTLEAKIVAEEIKHLMKTQPVTDKAAGTLRAARYSDIVILLRSLSGWADSLVEVLNGNGIPAHTVSSTGYFSTVEVQTVLSMLRLLDNPRQDIPMAAVLRSPMAGLTDEELAVLRLEDGSVPFHEAVLELAEGLYEEDGQKEISDSEADRKQGRNADEKTENHIEITAHRKLLKFYKKYKQLRQLVPDTPIHELIEIILRETGYGHYVAAMPAGNRRTANLNMLLEKATAYEKTSYKGLFHFVRYIDELQKYDVDFGEADMVGENEDVVRIMSIHKSKGLEFPIVIVSGMGKNFNKQDTRSKMVLHPELGIGLDYMDGKKRIKSPTIAKKAIAKQIDLENLGEELRVLYVALTRAKEKLILTGTLKDAPEKLEFFRQQAALYAHSSDTTAIPYLTRESAAGYLDWILPAVLSYGDKYPVRIVEAAELVLDEVENQLEQNENLTERIVEIEAADTQLVGQLKQRFSQRYPYQTDILRKNKYSVSELKHRAMREKFEAEQEETIPAFLEEPVTPTIPLFIQRQGIVGQEAQNKAQDAGQEAESKAEQKIESNTANRGALRGTAVHRVMECYDFTSEKSVQEQMDAMEKEEKITADMRALVKEQIVADFVSSETGRRMALAQCGGALYREKPFVMGFTEEEMERYGFGAGAQMIENEAQTENAQQEIMSENVSQENHMHEEDLTLIQGIIDVFWIEDDGITVLDYKTDRVDTVQELIDRYATQLKLYADALERVFATRKLKVKEILIYSFRLEKLISIE
ncbi:helicase-exonuclease AddAB subunit AddA [Roseburia inulinivorans]|jgi:ATP-dependent helicase/nuclease subunit A|uniref:ATP-dependent helicase/nuclease subunit A n=2 Tax=root TaxID=1 RepID=A0A396AHV3_9FIRM|nr:helicase-exonuclease AddAB subunit AddA [Roseburia inulinivorans]RHD05087.1 helicase-exonuclease AddAB subunit AddA [Roseburia inulinivorans]